MFDEFRILHNKILIFRYATIEVRLAGILELIQCKRIVLFEKVVKMNPLENLTTYQIIPLIRDNSQTMYDELNLIFWIKLIEKVHLSPEIHGIML